MTPNFENWTLLIVNSDASEILVKSDGKEFELARITLPANQRIAASIVDEAQKQFGLRIIALYEIFPHGHSETQRDCYHAAVAHSFPAGIPCGMFWTPIRPLLHGTGFRTEDTLAMETLWSKWNETASDRQAEPFVRSDWFAEVTDWIQRSLETHSMFLTGPFRQFNASATFSLIRFETNRTPVWFKAVGHPNIREFSVTLALANLCPTQLPKILASNRNWNAWLAEDASGISLAAATSAEPWKSAADNLALLQLLTVSQEQLLCESRVRDLRSGQLLELVPQFFECMARFQLADRESDEEQPQTADLPALREAVVGTLVALKDLHIPDTVGHMDLNPQNIFCSGSGSVFLDWADSFLGCPFFSFEYLLQHFRRTTFADSVSESQLRDSYFGRWRGLLSAQDFPSAMPIIPLSALFSYAATLCCDLHPNHLPPPAQRGYLLQLVRKMDRMSHRASEVHA